VVVRNQAAAIDVLQKGFEMKEANPVFFYFTWKFKSEVEHLAIDGAITAPVRLSSV
jgi:hypothetical protein